MCLVFISISATYYYLPVVVIIELSTNTAYCIDGVPTKWLQFSSKQEVTKNLGCLGQWMKVFICYSPSVSSKDTKGKLESHIYAFARHLITYVTRFVKRGLMHAQFQDTLFIPICQLHQCTNRICVYHC